MYATLRRMLREKIGKNRILLSDDQRRRLDRALILPKALPKLWEGFESVLPENLLPDPACMLFAQLTPFHSLGQHLRQTLARELGGAVNPLGVLAVPSPHDPAAHPPSAGLSKSARDSPRSCGSLREGSLYNFQYHWQQSVSLHYPGVPSNLLDILDFIKTLRDRKAIAQACLVTAMPRRGINGCSSERFRAQATRFAGGHREYRQCMVESFPAEI
jgi:hypothetical protein